MMPKINMNKFIKVISLNILILIFILISLELILRVLHIPYNQKWTPSENAIGKFDEDAGWSYLPNISRTLTIGENTREYYFDKDGIRVPNAKYTFDYQKPTILFIGSSYTMGHGLSYEETFEAKLEVLLRDKGYQCVNLGVQGYGSDQALIRLKKFINKFNTKIVIYTFNPDHLLYDSNNDRRMLFPDAKFLGTKPLFSLDNNDHLLVKKQPEIYSNYTNSYLFDLIQMTIGRRMGLFPPYSTKLTKALISEINRTCIANQSRFILLNWRNQPSDYNEFNDLNIETIDILENPPPNWQSMAITGDGHPNDEATNYVAKLLFLYLTNKNAPVPNSIQ